MIHEKFPDDFHRFDKTRELKKIAVSRADHIICISENTRQDLISLLNVPWEKTSVIHLGVDSPPNGLSCSPEEGIKRPYLLYIGQRGGYKNFLGLIKAYAVSADLTNDFDIICFGGGAFSKSEKKLFDQLKIGNKIHRAGGSDDILCRLFAHATLLVYPSLYEGFGLPPLEAMVHGCPVACSNTSSIPEVVGNAGAYFDPNDVESIRATLEDVATAQQKRQELSEAGFSRHKKFTWEKCAEETLSVYQRLI
jgi:glycosyltransferase involved in cell wall biosynthesis